jgi:hypothetical protein
MFNYKQAESRDAYTMRGQMSSSGSSGIEVPAEQQFTPTASAIAIDNAGSSASAPGNEQPLYVHLPHKDSIRLLEIQPGIRGSPIVCTMNYVRLQSLPGTPGPDFEALSYTWGVPGGDEFLIVCNTQAMKVKLNLIHALHQLRRPDRVRTIWVDAICT